LRTYSRPLTVNTKKLSKTESEALAIKKKKLENLLKEEKEKILIAVKKALEMGQGRILIAYRLGKTNREESFSSFFPVLNAKYLYPTSNPKYFPLTIPLVLAKLAKA